MKHTANPGPQTEFLQSKVLEVLYGGRAGGGKTWALVVDPVKQVALDQQRYERGEISRSKGWSIHFRRVMPHLQQTINMTREYYKAIDRGAKYNENSHTWTWSCGYHSEFAHLQDDHAHMEYASHEFTHIAFDELTEHLEEPYFFMMSRLRTSDPVLMQMRAMRSATNPLGRGLLWVRKYFIEPAPPKTVIRKIVTLDDGTKIERDRMFIPAGLRDNPFLGKEYEAELKDKRPAIMRALLYGDWYAVDGAFLGDVWEPPRHIIENRPPTPGTFRFRSCDYGYAAKSSVIWWEVDHDGTMTAYHSLTVKGHTGVMLANRIREIEEHYGDWNISEGRSMLNGPLDRACWSESGHNAPSIAEDMIRLGVYWYKSEKNRLGMADQIRKRLMARVGPDKSKPLLRFMKRCTGPITSLPVLPADPNDPEDVDTRADDHDWDSTGYACLSRPVTPEKESSEDKFERYIDELAAQRTKRTIGNGGIAALGGGNSS